MPSLKTRLKNGNTAIGTWVCTASNVAAELLAACDFDFVTLDAEHAPLSITDAHGLFQAIRSGNPDCASLVRLEGIDYASVKRYLDAGADGVIAPLVNTAAQAKEVVRSVKYPPLGDRGLGFCRANKYGMVIDESFKTANDETFVAVQIEHIEAVKNIDEILSVKGVDAAFIGPFDLSASMGLPGQFDAPQVQDAISRILEACERHNISPGIHVVQPNPSEVRDRIASGFRFIAYSLDITMLIDSAKKGLREIRA